MKIKTLVCNCRGLNPAFEDVDTNTLPFQIESELDVDYALVHPELCGPGGRAILEDVLRSAEDDPDTYVLVGACAVEAQRKVFKEPFRATDFNEAQFVPVDISGTSNEGILGRLRERAEALAKSKKTHH